MNWKSNGKAITALLLFSAILVFYSFTYYHSQLFMYPSKMHSWAQADRLALALCFFDSGMNFFQPCTFSQVSQNGIVGVEFPIQSYLAAVLGHVFGRENISLIFRLEDVVITCIGLLFLFMACYRRTQSFVFSIVAPLFVFSSPVFIYYTCSYFPDTAGASMVFIAAYFILNFIEHRKLRDYTLAVLFLTLGTLIKTSIGLYFIGFVAVAVFLALKRSDSPDTRLKIRVFLIALFGVIVILANYFYIKYLNRTYDASLFWHQPFPFEGLQDFGEYVELALKPYLLKEYFILPQVLFWCAVVGSAIPGLRKDPLGRSTLLLALVYMIGALSMFVLLGHAMSVHEYYFISIFIPFFGFTLLIAMIQLHKATLLFLEGRKSVNIALCVSTIICFFFADYQANQRLGPDYNGWGKYYNTDWLKDSRGLMDSLGVPKEEKIVILNEPEPNLSLVYFDRKGYVMDEHRWGGYYLAGVEELMQEQHLKYLIVKEEYASRYLSRDSNFFGNFKLIQKKGEINVYQFK